MRMNKYEATEVLIRKSLHEAQFGSESVQVKNKKLFADIETLERQKGNEHDIHQRILKKHHAAKCAGIDIENGENAKNINGILRIKRDHEDLKTKVHFQEKQI